MGSPWFQCNCKARRLITTNTHSRKCCSSSPVDRSVHTLIARWESNPRPSAWKADALTGLSYSRLLRQHYPIYANLGSYLQDLGLEPKISPSRRMEGSNPRIDFSTCSLARSCITTLPIRQLIPIRQRTYFYLYKTLYTKKPRGFSRGF